MGDVAMVVPVIRAFINQHPNCRVTVVSKPFFKPLFAELSNVSFVTADVKKKHRGILGLFRLFRELKKKKITHIADFHDVLRSKVVRTLFRTTGVPVVSINKGRSEKKALTRPKNKVFKPLKTSHQRYADVLDKLGFPTNLSNPNPIQRKPLSKKITAITGSKESLWIGIAPFAAFKGKIYPLHLMEKVVLSLASNGFQLLLFGGGPNEIKQLNAFEKKHDNVLNTAGKFSFQEEIQLISSLDLMISMDSGNAHLAAMQQVKTITLWGVTHPYAGFTPFNQPDDYCLLSDLREYPKIPCSVYGNKMAEGYEKVMESISPESIVAKVLLVLNSK
ncbi:MAG: Lipopolysaccharide core heptosyltransferase RfaQ [Flavobacterium sp. SCGC AAA160-P02]|nr:MAG: Lipopolysaccharide core heptosyltransferase RfaQ [Flavobacterium sp. SCGC AAA160-P02]